MHHFIHGCSIFLTIIAVTCSKSIGLESNEDSQNISRIATIAPRLALIREKPEAVSKIDAKRSLVILVPSAEEEDESECDKQNAKRFKTSIRRERFSVPISKEKSRTFVRQGNTKNMRSNKRRADNTVVALKKPNVEEKPMTLAEAREKAKNDTFRDEDLLNSIREGLKQKSPIVGAPRDISSPNIRVVDEDDFVCYCKKKTKDDTNESIVSKPRYSTKNNNAGRKMGTGNKNPKKPAQKAVSQPISPISNQFPPQYPNYYPNGMYPALQHGGQGRVPYVPYIYNTDPRFPMLSNSFPGQIPPNMNVPINPAGNVPDSIVGQRAPTAQRQNCNKNKQAVEKSSCAPNMLGKSLTQSTEKPISSTTIIGETAPSFDEGNVSTPDYNLQSESVDPTEPSKTIESPTEAPNVGAANPESTDKSPTDLRNEDANKFETTGDGSGTLDYSDIKEVTSAYFTSKAYDNEITRGPGSFDDSYITSSGPMNTYPEDSGNNDADLQSRLNVPTQNSVAAAKSGGGIERLDNVKPDYQSPVQSSGEGNGDGKNDLVGESNPRSNPEESVDKESNVKAETDDIANPEEDGDEPEFTGPSPTKETTELIPTSLIQAPDESDPSTEIDDKDTLRSSTEFSTEYYATESPETKDNAGPLGSDYAGENFESDKPEQKIDGGNEVGEERSPATDSPTEGTIYSVGSGNDYTTIGEDFINRDNERVGAVLETTIRNENEDATPSVESTLKSSRVDDTVGAKGTSDPSLPFCDNTLLQKSIKAVINNFATGESAEMNGETVGSPMAKDLLPEIVKVPNLKGILSMPAIERTVLDRVKNLLSTMTGVPRKNLDTDWATNVIRNNLHHTMSAAPRDEPELPSMTVQERQFKNGQWITNMATLEPGLNEEANPSTDLEKVQASVKNLLRDPAINLQAAKNPAVQNMIVQSVRNSLKPENAAGGERFDDAVIQSALDNELSIMQMENAEATTTMDEYETTTFDTSNIDMNKLLDIAKNEAGQDEKKENEIGSISTTEQIVSSSTQSMDSGLVGATRDTKLSETSEAPEKVDIQNSEPVTLNVEGLPEDPSYDSNPTEAETNIVGATLKDEEEPSTVSFMDNNPPKMDPMESGNTTDEDKHKSTENLVGMANTASNREPAAEDFAYLGKISVKSKDNAEDVQSLKNSELFYVGDGVKLPLEIRKLEDGTYALSISRNVCEHLLDKECPCCVPVKGNVVRTVKRNSEKRNAHRMIQAGKRKRISKRESAKSILPNEPGKCDSADDSLQILSLPVETFARRYNLSLNLGKLQTPWNFGGEEKIDGSSRDRLKNARNREVNNGGTDPSRELSVQPVPENSQEGIAIAKRTWTNGNTYKDNDATNYEYQIEKQRNLEKFRYQRNIDRNTNKRAEIVKNVLNWLRDMILNTRAKR